MPDEEAGKTFHFRASGRSAHANRMPAHANSRRPGSYWLAPHGVAAASRGTGRDSVPPAAAPMQKRMQRAPSPAHSLSMGSHMARAARRSTHGLRPEARSHAA